MINSNDTAALLIQALPYIRRFTGKVIVVKVGGVPMTNPERARSLAKDVLLLHSVGIRPVAGPRRRAADRRADGAPGQGPRVPRRPPRHRRRDARHRPHGAGRQDQPRAGQRGQHARAARVGVAGEDGRLLEASQVDPALGFVGKVGKVRAGLLHALLDDGLIPIVSTVGADVAGQPYNVNADDAARAIAVAMEAEKLIYLTSTPGLLDQPGDTASLIHRLSTIEARARIDAESVTGGMIPNCSPAPKRSRAGSPART